MPTEMQLMLTGDGRGVNNKYWPTVHLHAFGGSAAGYVMYCGARSMAYRCFGPPAPPEDPRCAECARNLAEFQRQGWKPYRHSDIYDLWKPIAVGTQLEGTAVLRLPPGSQVLHPKGMILERDAQGLWVGERFRGPARLRYDTIVTVVRVGPAVLGGGALAP